MTKSRYFIGLALALFLSGGASTLSAQAPTEAPPPLTMQPVNFPDFHERTLANGAQVIVVEDHEQPIVTVSLRVRSGSVSDPARKLGVASFTAALLDKGTESRSALDIAETIDFVGGTLSTGASVDGSSVGATVLTEHLDTALVLMSDVVLEPTFPEDELETERERVISGLEVELGQPASLASRYFMREIYGEHPYGASQTPESVRAIERQDLVDFHQAHYRPDNALFVVAGAVDPDDVIARLNRHFAAWSGDAVTKPALDAPPAHGSEREITLVHMPGTVQAAIRIGHLMPPATHEDWTTLDVVSQVVGGGTTGWFFRILRGEKGYTYGAYANMAERLEPGYFQAGAEVRNEVADSAMAEFFRLLDLIRDEPVSEDDLRTARDYMTGSFPLSIETPQQVASQVASLRLLGRSDDYLLTYRDRISRISAEEVQEVARRHLHPDRASVVVVGDATQLHEKLEPFGSIRVIDTRGEPVAMADLEVSGATARLDASSIQPAELGYRMVMQGNPIVETSTTITREEIEGRKAVKASMTSSGMMNLTGEFAIDAATFEPIYSRGEQQAGPQSAAYEFTLEGEKVSGTLSMNEETTPVEIDAIEGILLPGMSDAALWGAELAPGTELSLPYVSEMTGTLVTMSVRVVGEATTSVPAGEFETYELEVESGGQAATIFVLRDAPHFLVKQEVSGQPIVLELTEIQL